MHAEGEQLVLALESVRNAALTLLPDPHKLVATVYDTTGSLVEQARVRIDGKPMHFQAETNTYQRAFRPRYRLIEVEHAGISNFFYLEQHDRVYRVSLPRRVLNRIIYFRPVRLLWKPFQDVVNTIRWGDLQGWLTVFDPDQEKKFRGYLTLNQPLYRPGDTVYFKGFVLKKHRPFRKPMQLELSGRTSKGYKTYTLAALQPYRRGAYEGSFVLHDSLALLLDAHATLRFVHKRKELESQFKLEDYELKGNSFSMRASRTKHVQGAPPTIILRGTDVNGLSLLGGEVRLAALTKKVENLPMERQLLVPDTLWQHRLTLDPVGDTQFQLPDSLFATTDMEYTLHATFKTAQQEYLK